MRMILLGLMLVVGNIGVADELSGIQIHRDPDGKIVGARLGGPSSSERLELTASSIESIAKVKGLKSLSLSFSTVDDEMLRPVAEMKDLVLLDLSFSNVTGKAIEIVAECPKLRLLELSACDVHDEHLVALEKTPQLVHLRLERTSVTDKGLVHIGKLKDLIMLDLQACEITDDGLKSMGHFPQLQSLYLTKSLRYGRDDKVDLTDDCIDYLASLNTIVDLRIGATRISDQGLDKLKNALPKARISTAESGILHLGVKKPTR